LTFGLGWTRLSREAIRREIWSEARDRHTIGFTRSISSSPFNDQPKISTLHLIVSTRIRFICIYTSYLERDQFENGRTLFGSYIQLRQEYPFISKRTLVATFGNDLLSTDRPQITFSRLCAPLPSFHILQHANLKTG
jgi:hypothetical protein